MILMADLAQEHHGVDSITQMVKKSSMLTTLH
nr:MAG TPA_asm: hypothetical protein [Caudoviricetes sp.]